MNGLKIMIHPWLDPHHRSSKKSLREVLTTTLLLCCLFCSMGSADFVAEAAKKKAGKGDAELEKTLEPMNKTLAQLIVKAQSRALFSPKESGELVDIKYQLLDLMKDNTTNPLLIKPVYQAAVLCNQREQFDDAMDLYNFLIANFADSPYGLRAKGELQLLKKQIGADPQPAAGTSK